MVFLTFPLPQFLARLAVGQLSQPNVVQAPHLPPTGSLLQALTFELADLEDGLLTLESYFLPLLPAEWPLLTLGDLLEDTVAELLDFIRF